MKSKYQVAILLVMILSLVALPVLAQAEGLIEQALDNEEESDARNLKKLDRKLPSMENALLMVKEALPEVKVLATDHLGWTIEVLIPHFNITLAGPESSTVSNGQQQISVRGFGQTKEIGWPSLPVGYFTLDLPANASIDKVSVDHTEQHVRRNLSLEIVKGSADQEIDEGFEGSDYPGYLVEAEVLTQDNGSSVLGLAVYPVQWRMKDNGREEVMLIYRMIVTIRIN